MSIYIFTDAIGRLHVSLKMGSLTEPRTKLAVLAIHLFLPSPSALGQHMVISWILTLVFMLTQQVLSPTNLSSHPIIVEMTEKV